MRYWSKRSPDRSWDSIVIGSGMGGMTSAALLAKLGHRVLVLEQHYVPGGFTHTFRRRGYTWDVGVHLVGEVTPHALPGRLLNALTDGGLRWEPVGELYDTFNFPDGFEIGFPNHPKAFRATLVEAFPAHAGEIDTYLAELRATVKSLRGWFLGRVLPGPLGQALGDRLGRTAQAHFTTTTQEVLDRIFTDPRLKSVVAAQWGYHGVPPSRSSWALQALVARHFLHGAWYPVGGASQIAFHLLRTVAEQGGWTRIVADVDEIILRNDRAVGVRLADGEELYADNIVSAVGALPTVERLLPETASHTKWATAIRSLDAGPAHVCLYMGFKGDIAAAGATAASQWFYRSWDHEGMTWDIGTPETGPSDPAKCLFVSFPSLKDPEHDPGPEQRHKGEIITFVPWEQFEAWKGAGWRKRGDEYLALKEKISQSLMDEFFRHRPELRPLLDYYELSTPLSTDTFVRPARGSIYGLATDTTRYANPWLRPRSPIPGLYMSGSDMAAPGVVGAMMGGLMAAAAVEPIKAGAFLARHGRRPPHLPDS